MQSHTFDVEAHKRRSVWFTPGLADADPRLRDRVLLIAQALDPEVEAMVGYGAMGSQSQAWPRRAEIEAAMRRLALTAGTK